MLGGALERKKLALLDEMKVLIGHSGRFGDLFINVPMLDYLKKMHPEASFYMPIALKFFDIFPAFLNQQNFTPFLVNGYADFPTKMLLSA